MDPRDNLLYSLVFIFTYKWYILRERLNEEVCCKYLPKDTTGKMAGQEDEVVGLLDTLLETRLGEHNCLQ
jgi:hypothetical protein